MRLGRRAPSWPPYQLVEEDIAAQAERRMERLERLYHLGQDLAWDGRQVLAGLLAKHGPPRLPAGREGPALKLLSILLWGELAAWAISADLAERIDDVEAKMAATSQAHDEARHFYVLRDYLRALGRPVPRLGGIGRRLLVGILETRSLAHKLVGMQLLVESNALSIFRGLVEAEVEPVLCELLPYYEKDEARHVGLGVMYLPRLLRRMSSVERAGVAAFQIRCVWLLLNAGLPLHEPFRTLGIEPRRLAERTVKLQSDILADMFAGDGAGGRTRPIGVLDPTRGLGPHILDFIHPGGDVPAWHRAALALWRRGAEFANRALA